MFPLMAAIIQENGLARRPYAEPFAGGCGLALALLYGGYVSDIFVNDIDASIWSFWHSVLNSTEQLVDQVLRADLTIDGWRVQREVFQSAGADDPLRLGFAAFYLNRTNRSGIIKGAGVIGGLAQTGHYKLDCRFNREDLARRIQRVAKYWHRIHLTRMDATDFLAVADRDLPKSSLLCIDPPYYHKGSSLYTSFYRPDDHADLAKAIQELERPWVVTYDNTPEISSLYADQERFTFNVSYSVQTKRVASELLIASPNLVIPTHVGKCRAC